MVKNLGIKRIDYGKQGSADFCLKNYLEFLRKPEPIDFENYEHHYHRNDHHIVQRLRAKLRGWMA